MYLVPGGGVYLAGGGSTFPGPRGGVIERRIPGPGGVPGPGGGVPGPGGGVYTMQGTESHTPVRNITLPSNLNNKI